MHNERPTMSTTPTSSDTTARGRIGSQAAPIRRWRRIAGGGLLASVLLLPACGFEDLWSTDSLDGEDGDPQVTATPSSTPRPTATPWTYRPTVVPGRTPSATPSPTPTPVPATDLTVYLPTLDDLPGGFEQTREELNRSIDEVSVESNDPAEYTRLLRSLGYKQSVVREFQLPDPDIRDLLTKNLLGMEVQVMEFRGQGAARTALNYQMNVAQERDGWNLDPRDVEQFADGAWALAGTANYDGVDVTVGAIFILDGNRLYRFVGIGGREKPFGRTEDIVREVLARQGN